MCEVCAVLFSVEINMIAVRVRSVTTCVDLIVQCITTKGYMSERIVQAIPRESQRSTSVSLAVDSLNSGPYH
jgi:hypothetical protein